MNRYAHLDFDERDTVERLIRSGRLASVKLSPRVRRIPLTALQALIAGGEIE